MFWPELGDSVTPLPYSSLRLPEKPRLESQAIPLGDVKILNPSVILFPRNVFNVTLLPSFELCTQAVKMK